MRQMKVPLYHMIYKTELTDLETGLYVCNVIVIEVALLQPSTKKPHMLNPSSQLSEQLRIREQAVYTAPAHELTTTHLEQKLADVEKTLAQKDKELSNKASKVQQVLAKWDSRLAI